jgi:hypothetical protein
MITGTEILETQLLDQTSETSSFLLSDKPPEGTSVKTDQTQEERDAAIPAGPQVRQILVHSAGAVT